MMIDQMTNIRLSYGSKSWMLPRRRWAGARNALPHRWTRKPIMFFTRVVPAPERWAEGAPFIRQAVSVASRALAWPIRVLRARRELAKLADLTDHELRDIGLMRQDLRSATALPLDEDPTLLLAKIVAERRRAERASRTRRT